jgi:hypothetical protein
VASRYALLMGMTGMFVALVRSLRSGTSFDAAIGTAACWMGILGIVGLIVGTIAAATIDESVRRQMEQQLATMQSEAEQRAQVSLNSVSSV